VITAVPIPALVTTAGTEEVPTCVEMKTYHENYNEEQDDYGAKHNLTTESVILVVWSSEVCGVTHEEVIVAGHDGFRCVCKFRWKWRWEWEVVSGERHWIKVLIFKVKDLEEK
jgi:hypothetical protein